MKKKKLAFMLSAVLCASCLPLNAHAANPSYSSYYYDDIFTVETEQFRYHTSSWGMSLETDLTDANWMVTGVFRRESDTEPLFYSVVPINQAYGERGNLIASSIAPYLDGKTLAVGDLFYSDAMAGAEIVPAEYSIPEEPEENLQTYYIGHGAEILGGEFLKVIRHEMITKPTMMAGIDPTEYLMDTSVIDSYARQAVPRDENGSVIGNICTVAAVKDSVCFLQNGCILGQKTFQEYSGANFGLQCGDTVYILADSINPIFPGEYVFGDSSEIGYLGKAADCYQTKELTVTSAPGNGIIMLEDGEGNSYQHIYYDYSEFGYSADLNPWELNAGDTVLCALYDTNPFKAVTVLERLNQANPETILTGDATGDGTLDILDVILVNKAIFGKAELSAEAIANIDFNQDSVPDSSDCLIMMKKIIKLI